MLNQKKINEFSLKRAFHGIKKRGKKKKFTRQRFQFENYTIQDLRSYVLEKQILLAEAIRNQDFSKIPKIINQIIRSKEARALAVYETISKTGYRSPGFSPSRPTTNSEYRDLMNQIWSFIKNPKTYKAAPLARTMIAKPNGGERPISVPTYIDRAMQHLFKFVLDVFCEETSDRHSFGFRQFRSPGWAAKAITLHYWTKEKTLIGSPKFVLSADITKCFDTINHQFILDNVANIKLPNSKNSINIIPNPIIYSWLKCGYIYTDRQAGNELNPTDMGVPQGGPISPIICNMVLNGLEKAISEGVKHKFNDSPIIDTHDKTLRRKSPRESHMEATTFRFADDFNVMCFSYTTAQFALQAANDFLFPRGLELNKEKTKIIDIRHNPFEFVGFEFKWIQGKTLTKFYNYPTKRAEERIKSNINETIREKFSNPYIAFFKINSILRGWCNYYSTGNSKASFSQLSYWLWHKIYHYLKDFYTNAPGIRFRQRVYRKRLHYTIFHRHAFPHQGMRKWWHVYTPNSKHDIRKKGSNYLALYAPAKTTVATPTISTIGGNQSGGLNAYHSSDREKLLKFALKWKKGMYSKIFKETMGNCKLCNCNLLGEIQSEIHHIQPIKFGGTNDDRNLTLLCKECHIDINSAVKKKNIDKIKQLEELGVLKAVSKSITE
uniref:Putative reverse transcriptase, intron maturase and HNH endonuclease n=1 Tax=Chaetophora lobata TaxID=1249516 RepID=A0A7U1AQ42_9CHLO|nr:putative reverse transcriptase, intron maturase and HNH endonuclease [Chaetophora lobata]